MYQRMALKLPHNKLPTVKILYHDNSVDKHLLNNELVNLRLWDQYNAGIYSGIENRTTDRLCKVTYELASVFLIN